MRVVGRFNRKFSCQQLGIAEQGEYYGIILCVPVFGKTVSLPVQLEDSEHPHWSLWSEDGVFRMPETQPEDLHLICPLLFSTSMPCVAPQALSTSFWPGGGFQLGTGPGHPGHRSCVAWDAMPKCSKPAFAPSESDRGRLKAWAGAGLSEVDEL